MTFVNGTDRTPPTTTPTPFNVAIACDSTAVGRVCQEALAAPGHQTITVQLSSLLIEQCEALQIDLIVSDAASFLRKGSIEAPKQAWPVQIVLVGDSADFVGFTLAADGPVYGCLAKPIETSNLALALAAAMTNFGRVQTLKAEVARLQQTLEDRKVIERAKGMMMKHLEMDEEHTFRQMRRVACNQNRKLVEVACSIVEAGSVFAQFAQEPKPASSEANFSVRQNRIADILTGRQPPSEAAL